MDPQAAMVNKINGAIEENPTGLLVMPSKDMIQVIFWQRPLPESPKVFWENFIGGVANNAIQSGRTTKADLMAYLDKLLK